MALPEPIPEAIQDAQWMDPDRVWFESESRRVKLCARGAVRDEGIQTRSELMRGRGPLRNGAVWAIIIGGHVMLLLLLSRGSKPVPPAQAGADERSVLFFPELPLFLDPAPATKAKPQRSTAGRTPEASSSEHSITVPSEMPSPQAPVDWFAEAERVAHAIGERDHQARPRAFGAIPQSPYRACKKRKSSFRWNPEPKKAGFIGIFPYVRVGERCVVALGFFGCAVGELPPANSHLFDDMHAVNRPTSSVPLLDDCAAVNY